MTPLRRFMAGLRALLTPARRERELDEELQQFLDAAVEQKMRAGLTRAQALRSARLALGSTEAVKDRVRDVGWESIAESFARDVQYAIRGLRRSPGFAGVAVLTLAFGIGATTAIFSLLDAVMLKSLPVRSPDELVVIRGGGQYPSFLAFRRHSELFVDLMATSGVTPLDVEVGNGPHERTIVSLVSGSYFSTLGVHAAVGRVFTADDDRLPGAHAIAVASYGYWQRRLGGDPSVLNREVRVSGTPLTIVGIAPPGFFGEQVGASPDLWVPLAMWGQIVPGRDLLRSPGTAWLRMIGRVRPGVSVSGVQPALTQTFQQVLMEIFGAPASDDVRREIAEATVTLEPVPNGISNLRTRFARPLQLLMGAVVLVLLIACANIANLLLARATARRREIDLRLALGMSRPRLLRQLLTESVVLASMGSLVGVAIAWLGKEALLRLVSEDGARVPVDVGTDARLVLFVVATTAITAVLFGLAPAWQSARAAVVSSLVSRHPGGGPRQRLRAVLIAGQVAVSMVLLMGAGLFLRTLANLRDVDLGFAADRLLVVDVNPQAAGYRDEAAIALTRRLLDGLGAAPGIAVASMSENAVLMGRDSSTNLMRPEGFPAGPDGYPRAQWDVVGPRYFTAMGIPVIAGRDFSERDDERSSPVVAINAAMARTFFGSANPIGQHLVWGDDARRIEIVAVTGDVRQSGPRAETRARFYLPYLQMPQIRPNWILASTRLLLRTAVEPSTVAPTVRQLIAETDARLSIASLDVGPDLMQRALVQERMIATLLVAFGLTAVGLACLGLYGLIAYHVVQRTNEIGIRMALGAARGDMLWPLLRRAGVWIVAGLAAGIPLALSVSRLAQNLLFGLSANDGVTLAAAVVVLSIVGLLAAYVPARRAMRIDPVAALRCE